MKSIKAEDVDADEAALLLGQALCRALDEQEPWNTKDALRQLILRLINIAMPYDDYAKVEAWLEAKRPPSP